MSNAIATTLLDEEIKALREISYAGLVAMMKDVRRRETIAEDGKTYFIEMNVLWDSRKGQDIRVVVAVDDGGVRASVPITGDFIMAPDGSFVDEHPRFV